MAKYHKLLIWQRGRELLRLVSVATAAMHAEGDLKSQMRRAAISVVSNIAEGAERSDREFHHFLSFALGSAAEIEVQIIIASDLGLVDDGVCARITDLTGQLARMIRSLMRYLDLPG
jgi:four helix bundle protein